VVSCKTNPVFPSDLPAAPGIPDYHSLAILLRLFPPAAEDVMSHLKPDNTQDPQMASLLGSLGELIREARQKVLRAVDTVQVQTCWQIGRHIRTGRRSAGGLWQAAAIDAGQSPDFRVWKRF
jgi:hypothetical protein